MKQFSNETYSVSEKTKEILLDGLGWLVDTTPGRAVIGTALGAALIAYAYGTEGAAAVANNVTDWLAHLQAWLPEHAANVPEHINSLGAVAGSQTILPPAA